MIKSKLLSLLIILVLSGCQNDEISVAQLDNIKLEIVNKTNQPEGVSYSIKLTNESGHVIKQNNIYLSFPLKTQDNGILGNTFKIEATGNKLNIKDNEELIVNVFALKKGYEGNSNLDLDQPYVEIKGYIDEMKGENMFHTGHGT
ncbi:hypothetical protein [Paenibacillus sp. V4I5]|uniref:hypothetical protein n=1 Tax=Paenibacillus sp. V4I5 TaxID=3042306 RepID=UPI002793E95C|nr:hypothetical protein [Paenibacillus sp. V4I5]MDQ0914581.1 hypothetical protein [Paenibacillus sp. V4I5]